MRGGCWGRTGVHKDLGDGAATGGGARDMTVSLEAAIDGLMKRAAAHGLDFFDMRFEICPPEVIYGFGAYGMPTRFAHWSFGKAFQRIKTEYDLNLSRIYELVINTDPCYAFLLEENSAIQNRLIVAHTLAHSDFFKNNVYFKPTSKRMLETMACAAERMRSYEAVYGRGRVEEFIDAVLAVREHVDARRFGPGGGERAPGPEGAGRDLLRYLAEHSPFLEDWQRDILAIIREEALYFRPQAETRILNEGWATYWHLRLMRETELNEADILEVAAMQAELTAPSRFSINPYLVGLKILESIERRYGEARLWSVRTYENDLSLIRNYLTAELVEKLDLYLYRRVGYEWRVVDRDWRQVRDAMVRNMINGGYPSVVVVDGDFRGRGELYLRHEYEGTGLDVPYLERTLAYVSAVWGRAVHLETVLEEKRVLFSCRGKGKRVKRRALGPLCAEDRTVVCGD